MGVFLLLFAFNIIWLDYLTLYWSYNLIISYLLSIDYFISILGLITNIIIVLSLQTGVINPESLIGSASNITFEILVLLLDTMGSWTSSNSEITSSGFSVRRRDLLQAFLMGSCWNASSKAFIAARTASYFPPFLLHFRYLLLKIPKILRSNG